jgi:2-polyprenyl-3-methyl-5-hydroxy-6-metoxy-1,4-benzoquinol methylase
MTGDFWDKGAERYDAAVRKHDADYDRTIASTTRLLSASDVVLDLGCASGEYSLEIAPFVRHVHGIDTSTRMIALAAKKAADRAIGNVTFDATAVFDRSLDAHGYTAVLAFSVLHLVDELRPVLCRVSALLPTGGLLVSQTPCFRESSLPFKLLLGLAQKAKMAPPMHRLAAPELDAAVTSAGFEIAESTAWDRKKAVHWIVARKR